MAHWFSSAGYFLLTLGTRHNCLCSRRPCKRKKWAATDYWWRSQHTNAGPPNCGCRVCERIKLLYYSPLLASIKEESLLFIIKLILLENYPSMAYGHYWRHVWVFLSKTQRKHHTCDGWNLVCLRDSWVESWVSTDGATETKGSVHGEWTVERLPGLETRWKQQATGGVPLRRAPPAQCLVLADLSHTLPPWCPCFVQTEKQ